MDAVLYNHYVDILKILIEVQVVPLCISFLDAATIFFNLQTIPPFIEMVQPDIDLITNWGLL